MRCAWMLKQPGVQGGFIQCRNTATHLVHIEGCGCADFDEEVCEKGADIPECDGPHHYGA